MVNNDIFKPILLKLQEYAQKEGVDIELYAKSGGYMCITIREYTEDMKLCNYRMVSARRKELSEGHGWYGTYGRFEVSANE